MTKDELTSITNFPEEIDASNGVKIYGQTSFENQMAVLSHYLHNHINDIGKKEQFEIIDSIRGLLSQKEFKKEAGEELFSDEQIWSMFEDAQENNLFDVFFNIPYKFFPVQSEIAKYFL